MVSQTIASLVGAIIALAGVALTTLVTFWIDERKKNREMEGEKRKQAQELENIFAKYHMPLLRASEQLAEQIQDNWKNHKLSIKVVEADKVKTAPHSPEAYAYTFTLFLLGQFFAHSFVFCTHYCDFMDRDKSPLNMLSSIHDSLSVHVGIRDAIANIMIQTHVKDGDNDRLCMGYPSFLSKWIQEDHNATSLGLRSWFDRIIPSLEALDTADDIRGGHRIVRFQDSLIGLVEALSSEREVAPSSPLRLELNALQSPRSMDQDFGPANSPTGPLEREPQTLDDTSSESQTTNTSAASSAIKPLRTNKNARKRSKSRSDGEEEHRIKTGRTGKRRGFPAKLTMTPSEPKSILPQ